MQFNITFKTIFECVLKKLVLCIQIRFVSTEKTTRIASRASCLSWFLVGRIKAEQGGTIYDVCERMGLTLNLNFIYNKMYVRRTHSFFP